MSTGWTATVARATSNVQAFATAADRVGIKFGPGELTYLIDQKLFQFWDGAAWQQIGLTAQSPWPPATMFPGVSQGASSLSNANYNVAWRSIGSGVVSKIALQVNVSSGNIAVGVYTSTVPLPAGAGALTRAATSGAIPCPASGSALVNLGASVFADQNSWFVIYADNVTATFFAAGVAGSWAGGYAPATTWPGGMSVADTATLTANPPTLTINTALRGVTIFMTGIP